MFDQHHSHTTLALSRGWTLPLGVMPPPAAFTSVAAVSNPMFPSTPPDILHPANPAAHVGVPAPPSCSTRLGMILSPAADPIPFRLVQRIQNGEFLEMRDLLADNVSLHSQLEDLHGHVPLASTPAAFRPRLREVPTLSSWMYCFMAYLAVRTRDPQTRDMLAYCRLVIREALRHCGNGWQEYDRSFRRQAAIDNTLPWNTLIPGLQAATLLGTNNGQGLFCTICREPDHNTAQCSLTSMQQPVHRVYSPSPVHNPAPISRNTFWPSRRPKTLLGIFASWNRGTCAYPGSCTYKHICGACQLDHKGIVCPVAPEGSPYHRLQLAARRRTPVSTAGIRK